MADEPIHTENEIGAERSGEPEGATPPGYDWPTHGGYLGCLIGVMFSCLLAPLGYIAVGFLGAFLSRPLGAVGVGLAIAATVIVYIALFIGISRLGWGMGKRFLREYPQPQAGLASEAGDVGDAAMENIGLSSGDTGPNEGTV